MATQRRLLIIVVVVAAYSILAVAASDKTKPERPRGGLLPTDAYRRRGTSSNGSNKHSSALWMTRGGGINNKEREALNKSRSSGNSVKPSKAPSCLLCSSLFATVVFILSAEYQLVVDNEVSAYSVGLAIIGGFIYALFFEMVRYSEEEIRQRDEERAERRKYEMEEYEEREKENKLYEREDEKRREHLLQLVKEKREMLSVLHEHGKDAGYKEAMRMLDLEIEKVNSFPHLGVQPPPHPPTHTPWPTHHHPPLTPLLPPSLHTPHYGGEGGNRKRNILMDVWRLGSRSE